MILKFVHKQNRLTAKLIERKGQMFTTDVTQFLYLSISALMVLPYIGTATIVCQNYR